MPVYNRADVVRRSVESVLRQSFRDLELLVIDDGSRDGTTEAVRAIADPRLKLIALERNFGGNAARNRGIRDSRAELLTFLDSDDEFLPDRLAETVQYFAGHPTVDLLVDACIKRWPEARGKCDFVRRNPDLLGNEAVLAALFDRRLFKATPGITVRRDAAIRAGLFDEKLGRRQDYDFILRVAKVGNLASRGTVSWVKMNSADAISSDVDRALGAIFDLWDRHPDHFARLNARTGMADDLARHLVKLAKRGKRNLLFRDARSVIGRFGAVSVSAMLLGGLRTFLSRKVRRHLS